MFSKLSKLFIVSTIFITTPTMANEDTRVQQAIDTIVLFCLSGGSKLEISGGMNVDGGINIKRLGASGEAEIKINKSETQGLINGIQQTMDKISADQASEARQCMKPYLDRILDLIISQGEKVSATDSKKEGCAVNDTFQCSKTLIFGSTDTDEFPNKVDNVDKYYSFELDAPSTVNITLDPMPNYRGVDVTIYKKTDYSKVINKKFQAGQPGIFSANLREAGLYYIELSPSPCCKSNNNFSISFSKS